MVGCEVEMNGEGLRGNRGIEIGEGDSKGE